LRLIFISQKESILLLKEEDSKEEKSDNRVFKMLKQEVKTS